jgi:hypothetical protein
MPPDPSKLKPGEYIEDGIVYTRDTPETGWKYFDEGGTLDEDEDAEQAPAESSEESDEDL